IQSNVTPGMYWVLSCADDPDSVLESDETNNCLASATKLTVALPDLVVTAITVPTTPVTPGSTFTVTDKVNNQGTVAAGAFIVAYYLSANTSQDAAAPILGSR